MPETLFWGAKKKFGGGIVSGAGFFHQQYHQSLLIIPPAFLSLCFWRNEFEIQLYGKIF